MNIHLIAIGGAIMHNLALALQKQGHHVSGSDDEIYNPARDRLAIAHLLPKEGWDINRIHKDLDLVILGMHAKADNPELLEAQRLDLKIQSFPEFISEFAREKKKIVVAGSHGKTTTTSMIMHVLKKLDFDFDYLVGAQLDGFDLMVSLSDAPIFVIEGDEYLSSAIDRRPKIMHYDPDFTIITGIEWDHMNVFPTLENYHLQFEKYIGNLKSSSLLFYYAEDSILSKMAGKSSGQSVPYTYFETKVENDQNFIQFKGELFPIKIFGQHNMANLKAAAKVCTALGISELEFLHAIEDFNGAAKRLELVNQYKHGLAFRDFAHAPSKVRATVNAVAERYDQHYKICCVELHTYSSLNKDFIPQYYKSLNQADLALVCYSPKTLEIKKLDPIDPKYLEKAFDHPNIMIFTDPRKMVKYLYERNLEKDAVLLWMSSGTFGGLDLNEISKDLLS